MSGTTDKDEKKLVVIKSKPSPNPKPNGGKKGKWVSVSQKQKLDTAIANPTTPSHPYEETRFPATIPYNLRENHMLASLLRNTGGLAYGTASLLSACMRLEAQKRTENTRLVRVRLNNEKTRNSRAVMYIYV